MNRTIKYLALCTLILAMGCASGIKKDFFVEMPLKVWVCSPGGCGVIEDGKVGAAVPVNTIYVYGETLPNGKVTVNHRILGHEVQHILSWHDSRIVNPDRER